MVTYLEVATQLGKVPTPIIMYGHIMAEGGGGVKKLFGKIKGNRKNKEKT